MYRYYPPGLPLCVPRLIPALCVYFRSCWSICISPCLPALLCLLFDSWYFPPIFHLPLPLPSPLVLRLRLCCLKLLAVGWADGQVSTWNVMESLQENASTCACSNQGVHKQPITVIIWNPSGTRLVTGDKARHACVGFDLFEAVYRIFKLFGRGNKKWSFR